MVDQIGTLKNKKPYFPMMHDNKDLESFCYLLATKFYNHLEKLEDSKDNISEIDKILFS